MLLDSDQTMINLLAYNEHYWCYRKSIVCIPLAIIILYDLKSWFAFKILWFNGEVDLMGCKGGGTFGCS